MKDIGLLGLGVMGGNLALNISNKGFKVAVFNWSPEETRRFVEAKVKEQNITPYYHIQSFAESLSRPRKIILMVKSGSPVDNMILELLPYLDEGDVVLDGGNSHFKDTSRRMKELRARGIHYLGVGVSGGEEGALHGPSIMPGGTREAYVLVENILRKIAAQTEAGPCCTYVGDDAAGHFVKMIHNGIEYGIMQGMSEAYHILKKVLRLNAEEIGRVFGNWNLGELNSYLMEISNKLMLHRDKTTGLPTVDLILDQAGQKGTGRWTVESALELGVPTPSLNAAVEGRMLSFFKEDRERLAGRFEKEYPAMSLDQDKVIGHLEKTLLFSNLLLFSQGLWLMSQASKAYGYHIDPYQVLKIWKGGCIIRAKMLDFIVALLEKNKENIHLLDDERTLNFLSDKLESVKYITNLAKEYYIPVHIYHTSLDYFFAMVEEKLPANFTQAQRDFFGAHTYERVDQLGVFHTKWEEG